MVLEKDRIIKRGQEIRKKGEEIELLKERIKTLEMPYTPPQFEYQE